MQTDLRSRRLTKAVAVGLMLMLGGCNVYQSTPLEAYAQTINTRFCKSTVGSYTLPKGELVMRIERKSLGNDGNYHYELSEGKSAEKSDLIAFIGDNRYCLDFRSNGFYADSIGVTRDSSQLLTRVYSNTEDKAKGVIQAVAEGVGTVIAAGSGARRFSSDDNGTQEVVQLRFDPFDQDLLTQINDAILYTGHCIYIESEGDPYVPLWMLDQCTNKKVVRSTHAEGNAPDKIKLAAGSGRFGIFYKPVLPHTLVILKKDDPTSAQSWRVWKKKVIELPNRAPPFMIEVKRGLFTDRKTDITFQSGMLQSVKVDKKSELNAVADILVSVAQIAVQIPAKALIISTSEATNQKALIETNQALIQTLNALKAEQQKYALRAAGLTPDQLAALDAAGGRSYEACVQTAALSTPEGAERVCSDLRNQGQ
ncbi:hypothetical protein NKI09_15450 [Mesorhizobium sp. M0757]|uniref:hypothetical protein n=1 Tax=Mesorhizobium sp. M0757 TaxID=2956993 RepID=UPI003334DC07